MGKWWKCRQCSAYNLHSRTACGHCKSPMQDLAKPRSTPTSPAQVDYIPPKGKGKNRGKHSQSGNGYGNGYASGRGGGGNNSNNGGGNGRGRGKGPGSSPPSNRSQSVDSTVISDSHSLTSTAASPPKTAWQRRAEAARLKEVNTSPQPSDAELEANQLVERMDTVQALINSLVGRADQCSIQTTQQLQQEMSMLRIKKTKLKPLKSQESVLTSLVERRQAALREADTALIDAHAAKSRAAEELLEAETQLANVQKAMVDEEKNKVCHLNGPHVLNHGKEMAALLPPDKAVVFNECLGLLSQLLSHAHSQVPAQEVVSSAVTATPLSGSPVAQSREPVSLDVGMDAHVEVHAVPQMPEFPTLQLALAKSEGKGSKGSTYGACSSSAQLGSVPQCGRGAARRDPYGSPPPGSHIRARSAPSSPAGDGMRSRSSSRRRLIGKQVAPWISLDHHFSQNAEAGTVPS